jgi:uncharacterized protein
MHTIGNDYKGLGNSWFSLMDEGEAILRYERQLVEGIVSTRRTMKIAGHVVPVANCPGALASEVGNALCLGFPATGRLTSESSTQANFDTIRADGIERAIFSATYYAGGDGKRHFSLRSPPGGAHVGNIARETAARFTEQVFADQDSIYWQHKFVGGGHEHAAGFDAPIGWEGE